MSPVTHFFTEWVFANCFELGRRDRALVTLACVVPDIDGLGIVPELLTRNSAHPLLWFSLYHHTLHSLAFAVVIAAIAYALATQKWTAGLLALLSFHIHLFEDVLGARGPDGYQWPIPYLAPFSPSVQLQLEGTMGTQRMAECNAHAGAARNHILACLEARIFASGDVSAKADLSFVAALRRRFPAGMAT